MRDYQAENRRMRKAVDMIQLAPEGRMTMGYLSPRKRWYHNTCIRVLIALAAVYVLLTAVLVLTHA